MLIKNNIINKYIARLTLLVIWICCNMSNILGQIVPEPSLKQGYLMVFVDEFEGTSFDEDKWIKSHSSPITGDYDKLMNNRHEYFRPRNCTVRDGKAIFTMKQETFDDYLLPWKGDSDFVWVDDHIETVPLGTGEISNLQTWEHSCAQVRTRQKFKFGIFEVYAKLTKGSAQVPAFWMFGDGGELGKGKEIDWFEGQGIVPEGFQFTLHWYSDDPPTQSPSWINLNLDLSQNYHRYTGLWEEYPSLILPQRQIISFDGTFKRLKYVDFTKRLYILLTANLFSLGGWPIDNNFLPSDFEVEYIAVYKEYIDDPLIIDEIRNEEDEPTVFVQKSITIGLPAFSHIEITNEKYVGSFFHCYSAEDITILGELTVEEGVDMILDNIQQVPGGAWVQSTNPY